MANPFADLNNKIRDADDRFTKREYIAAKMLQGLISRERDFTFSATNANNLTISAIQIADMLIENLRTRPTGAVVK
jgi:hypothetical protein